MVFRHVHLCTNEYPYSYWLYHVHVCTNDYPFLLNGFSSCTCLYERLSISFEWNDYPFPYEWVFVMYISVRMTIHFFWMGFRHVHVCTNSYPIPCECIVVIYISVRMTTISLCMDCRHLHFCTNDYHFFLNGFLSCTFLYKWLSISFWMDFVMHISAQMTIHFFWMVFRHSHFCTDDYLYLLNGFSPCTCLYE